MLSQVIGVLTMHTAWSSIFSNLLNASEDVLAERIEEAKAAVEEWIYCLETD